MSTPTDSSSALRANLDAHLAAHDRAAAVVEAVEAISRGDISVSALYLNILAPLMMETGNAWQAGEIEVWEEHFATATVYTIVDALYPEVARLAAEATAKPGTVLLACPPEEEHDLGLRMLSDRFEIAGWDTTFLGANTPVDDIVAAARKLGANLIVLSSSTHYHRVRLCGVVETIEAELPDTRVVAGGAAFLFDSGDWPEKNLFAETIIAQGA